MDRFFYSFLPLIWLLAAAIVSAILYKTSEALIKSDTIAGLPVKEVKVAGSAAIFVIIYVLLWKTTWQMAVLDQDRTRVGVPQTSWNEAQTLINRIEANSVRLEGCGATPLSARDCGVDLEALRRDVANLKQALTLPVANSSN